MPSRDLSDYPEGDDYDDGYPPACSSDRGHRWVFRDDDDEVSYCENCGVDGNG